MSGMGLCWAIWPGTPGPGACKPERWMLRGKLLFCPETVHGSGRAEEGPEVGQTNALRLLPRRKENRHSI